MQKLDKSIVDKSFEELIEMLELLEKWIRNAVQKVVDLFTKDRIEKQ